ncbi:MAG: hypothetical protein AB7G48_20125 [Nitrospiraceae bacterium]
MAAATPTARIILESVARVPGCRIEEVLSLHPDLTWNQVFAEIDRLSREGAVLVTLMGRGEYALSLPPHKEATQYPRCDIAPECEPAEAPLVGGESQRKVEAA